MIKKILLLGFIALLAGGIALGFLVISAIKTLPDPQRITERQVAQSTKIFDRTGEILLYEIHGDEKRTVISFEKIPDIVKKATLAAEDAKFYTHVGLDFKGIFRAFLIDIVSGDIKQGGSTITQQLVKNSLLGREQTITRKIKEAILSVMLESKYSKDEILNMYLNQIPYGSNTYGIETAAETYFGKQADSLTLSEAALLAALPKAPTYYSPYGQHRDELINRKNLIIERMIRLGFIDQKEGEKAKNENINFITPKKNIKAPHFVMFVKDYLNEKYGESVVEQGGLKVYTTLDWNLQQEAEKIIKEGAEKNKNLVEAYNAALVSINPKNGEILAMVGSKDYWGNPEPDGCRPGVSCKFDPHVNVATRERQPGSAFKPFVYSAAFKKGFTPETVLFDVPTEFNPLCNADGTPGPEIKDPNDCYHPQNYDGNFRGPVSLRQSLAQSLNIPSVKLLYLAGIQNSIDLAKSMGITTLNNPQNYGLSLVLGGAEVKLIDMTSAFGVFANDGLLHPKTAILRIEDANGKILEEKIDSQFPVLDTEIARTINDILSDNDARVPIFSPHSSLYFPDRKVAAKTGTTQDFRDAWVIGYTPSLVSGVWVGNNDNTPMNKKSLSIMVAGPIWHNFMEYALKNSPPEEFIKPNYVKPNKPALRGFWQGTNIITIDSISKKLATIFTPPELTEEIAVGEPHSILYYVNKDDPTGEMPANPYADPQFKNWEISFQKWLIENNFKKSEAPKENDDIHTPESKPTIQIVLPKNTEIILRGSNISGLINSRFPFKEVSFFLNDVFIESQRQQYFNFIVPKSAQPGDSIIKIKAYDAVGNSNEIQINTLLR